MKKLYILTSILLIPFIVGCGDDDHKVVHHQGHDCLTCHSFSSAGTIYHTLRGKYDTNEDVAKDYTIQLLLDNGSTVKYKQGNGEGNVLWRGDTGDLNDFTAQVLDTQGKVVNSSKKNSHNVGRLACNICHSELGLNGAPGRIVSYQYNTLKEGLSSVQ